jgi:hypothetical protein
VLCCFLYFEKHIVKCAAGCVLNLSTTSCSNIYENQSGIQKSTYLELELID